MNYFFHLLIYFDVYIMVALSLNLIVGFCGMLTLAHAAYFTVGGYAYGIVASRLGLGFFPSILIAAFVAAILSLAVSLPSWRLNGDFFVLSSLAVQTLILSAIQNWYSPLSPIGSWGNLTNGPFGISGIPHPFILGLSFDTPPKYSLLATFIVIACISMIWRLKSSPWGRLLLSMRDDELATRGLGKDTRLLKVQAIAFACAFVAIAGVVYVGHIGFIDPSSASLDESILMLSMLLVGGTGNFRGPIIGAILLVSLPEVLRFVQLPDAVAANLRLLIYGITLVVLMHYRPSGIAGVYRIK